MQVDLVPMEILRPHELTRPKKVDELEKMTNRWNAYVLPLVVDKNTGVILDGHHRMYTLKVVAPETPVRAYIIDARPLEALEWMRDYMEYGAPGAAYEEM